MTIFERIKNKAAQALTGVTNFIDQDKNMGGIQLAKGGLLNRVNSAVQDWQAKPANQTFNAIAENIPTTPQKQENINRSISDILGERTAATTAAQGFNNWLSAPLFQIPYNIGQAANPENSGWSRVGHGAQAAFGLIPGLDDAVMAGYNAAKNTAAKRDISGLQPGLAGNEFSGLGDAVTGGQDTPVANILNAAEIPLLLLAGGLKAKNADEAIAGLKKTNIDDITPPAPTINYFKPRGSSQADFIVDEMGNANKVKTATKAQVESLIPPADKTVIQTEVKGLPTGKLPEPTMGEVLADDIKANPIKPKSMVGNFIDHVFVNTADKLKSAMGEENYTKYIDPLLTKYKSQITAGNAWKATKEAELADLVKNTGIKVGGDEDKLLYSFRAKNGYERVVGVVGKERADQLAAVYQSLRAQYDNIIDTINVSRREAGMTEIPKKDDFLSQLHKGSSLDKILGNLSGSMEVSDELSSAIFKKQGAQAEGGAIENMANYLERAKMAGFTDIAAKEINTFRNTLAGVRDVPKQVLDELAQLESNITGGGKNMSGVQKAAEAVMGKMKGAAVVGKASTLVNQALSLPHGIANTGVVNFVKGFSREAAEASKKSDFLSFLRHGDNPTLRTGNAYTKTVARGGDALRIANERVATSVWSGLFEKAKQMNVEDPIKWADDEAARILGDRRNGLSTQFYNTFLGKMFGAFTIEQTAAVTSLAQNMGAKKWGTVIGTLIAWKLGNDLSERFGTGVRPFFDPVEAISDTAELATGSNTKEKNTLKAVLRPMVEAIKLAPPLASGVYSTYKLGETVGVLPESDKVFDQDPTWMNVGSLFNPIKNWDRNITGNKVIDVPVNIASNFLPGVDQLAKTAQAGVSLGRGYAETKGGDPMYQMPTNPFDQGRALLFGQSSTPEARNWFDNDFAGWMTDKQKAAFEKITSPEEKLAFLDSVQSKNQTTNQLKSAKKNIGSNKSISAITGGGTLSLPTSKAEAEANKSVVTEMLGSGITPSKEDIAVGLFQNKSALSKSIEERTKVYEALKPIITDEYLSDEQKAAAIEAAGTTPQLADYYELASKDQDVRLQEMLPQLDNMDTPQLVEFLMKGRRAVAGKQLVSNTMVDYLYENDYLDKNAKEAIKALKYDEIKDEFYFSKSFSGSGGKKLSYKQALKLYQLDLPKFSSMKQLDTLLGGYGKNITQTGSEGEKLLEEILNAPTQSKKGLWF